jgi:exodeoxyribonuclease VII small subunit
MPARFLPKGLSSAIIFEYTVPALSRVANVTKDKNIDLEKALAGLEAIVEELESGDLPLEKAMQKFEEGVKLTRSCQSALRDAEQKVEILLKSAGSEEALEEFDPEDEG